MKKPIHFPVILALFLLSPKPQTVTFDQTDLTQFSAVLKTAFEKRNVQMLEPLLAPTLQCDFADGDGCQWRRGCPKAEVISTYFKDDHAEGWGKFDLFLRYSKFQELPEVCDPGMLIAPIFPDTNAANHQQFAYVFADNVNVRSEANKNGKVLGKCSRSFVPVDTDELCYGDTPDNWLPIFLKNGDRAYMFIDYTNWSDKIGFVYIAKNAKGQWQVVRLIWGRHAPGTWYLPGCC